MGVGGGPPNPLTLAGKVPERGGVQGVAQGWGHSHALPAPRWELPAGPTSSGAAWPQENSGQREEISEGSPYTTFDPDGLRPGNGADRRLAAPGSGVDTQAFDPRQGCSLRATVRWEIELTSSTPLAHYPC